MSDQILPDSPDATPGAVAADPVTLALCECLRIVTDLAVRLAEIDLEGTGRAEQDHDGEPASARAFRSVTGSTAMVSETPTGWVMSATVGGRRRLSREFQTQEDAVRALALVDEGWKEER